MNHSTVIIILAGVTIATSISGGISMLAERNYYGAGWAGITCLWAVGSIFTQLTIRDLQKIVDLLRQ